MQYMDGKQTDGMLLLGDNAYNSGTDAEYQSNFFPQYQDSLLRNVVLWPAPGNHDYANNATRQNDHAVPYYSMFTLPTAGESGGVASGTEAFYSFDFAFHSFNDPLFSSIQSERDIFSSRDIILASRL